MKREDEKKDLDEIMLESLLQGKFPLIESGVHEYFVKKMFWMISQNSHKNKCDGALSIVKLLSRIQEISRYTIEYL